jgi:hypothetical protein
MFLVKVLTSDSSLGREGRRQKQVGGRESW